MLSLVLACVATAGGWEKLTRADPAALVKMSFAIRLKNLDKLDTAFWSVSNPESPQRGHFLSQQEIWDLTSDIEAAGVVLDWIRSSSTAPYRVRAHKGSDFIVVWASVRCIYMLTIYLRSQTDQHTHTFLEWQRSCSILPSITIRMHPQKQATVTEKLSAVARSACLIILKNVWITLGESTS